MRITTGSMMRSYNSRLNKVMNDMTMANEKVLTKRKYLKASESPADAIKGYRLEREMTKTEDQLNNLSSVESTYESMESSMMKISNMADDVYARVLQGISGQTSPEQRKIIATEIRSNQEAMVMELNAKFEGKQLFGGTETKEPPFKLNGNILTFRGIDVNSTDADDQKILQAMSKETQLVDLGFGLNTDAGGNILENTAFDTSMSGLNFLGFGQDPATGLPKNLVTTLGELANTLDAPNFNADTVKPFSDQLDKARTQMLVSITDLGSKSIFLENTRNRLENNEYNLNKKIVKTEFIDMDEAITDFKMQEYVYQAALKMGSKILTPSFIDFMN